MRIDFEGQWPMIGGASPRNPRPWLQLLSALLRLSGEHGELLRHAEYPWCSVTFAGTRHKVLLSFAGVEGVAAGEAFLEALPEYEFSIARQIVADATAVSVVHEGPPEPQMTVEVELLLVENPEG
jgi:hypothetical protein